MPEYILPVLDRKAFQKLDGFTQGYITALFFTENDPTVCAEDWTPDSEMPEGSIPNDAGFDDIHPDTLAAIIKDCEAFQSAQKALLEQAYEIGEYDDERAGNDYWYTRNGHGTGFWDRELGQVGDDLAEACRYDEIHPYALPHSDPEENPQVHI